MGVDIVASLWRAGASRVLLLADRDLVGFDQQARDRIIMSALKTLDRYQPKSDGVGGRVHSPVTAVVQPAVRGSGAQIAFRLAHVDGRRHVVDWSKTCGDAVAAIGPSSVGYGYVPPVEPRTRVSALNLGTGERFEAEFEVRNGTFEPRGEMVIDEVPGTGSAVRIRLLDPGSGGRGVLPTGRAIEELPLENGDAIWVTIVDVGHPTIFVRFSDLKSSDEASLHTMDSVEGIGPTLIQLQEAAATRLADNHAVTTSVSGAALPKIAIVSEPQSYTSTSGRLINEHDHDLRVRVISGDCGHDEVDAVVASAVGAFITGSVAYEVARVEAHKSNVVRIGQRGGVLAVNAEVRRLYSGRWIVPGATITRTARQISTEHLPVPAEAFNSLE